MTGVCMHDAALTIEQSDLNSLQLQGFKIRQVQSPACDLLFSRGGSSIAFFSLQPTITDQALNRISKAVDSFKVIYVLLAPSLATEPQYISIISRFALLPSVSIITLTSNSTTTFVSYALTVATAAFTASANEKEWRQQQCQAVQSAQEQTAILAALPWAGSITNTSTTNSSGTIEDQATTLRMLGSIGHISSCQPQAFAECNGVDLATTAQRIAAVFHT